MRKSTLMTLAAFCLVMAAPRFASAHCQIPCGIYDDEARFTTMLEHVTTIEKSMNEINRLSKDDEDENGEDNDNYNQIVRWVMNKEKHADEFSEIVTYYFLAQRIKPVEMSDAEGYKAYLSKLEMLHHMVVYAMKCKQTTDTANTDKLRELIGQFKVAYHGHE